MALGMKQQFELFADYHQFYLQDEQAEGNLSNSWTEQAVSNMLAVAPGVIGVRTVRNMDVPVEVEVLDSQPDDNFNAWDHVTEASLEVPSGRIIIAGCTDYFPDAARITVQPGTYKVRIYYGALDSVDEELGLDGDDHYRVVLWLDANKIEPKVLKRWEFAPNSSSNQELEETPATKLLHQAMDKSRQRLFQEAIEYYTQAIQLNTTFHEAYFLRSCVKYKLGDRQGGIEDIEKVIDIFFNQGDLKSASFYHEWLNQHFEVSK
jgi:tetratricopeptide (TPR) repeat protein